MGRKRFVSIHAPAWGATHDSDATQDAKIKFQSTRPRGARQSAAVVFLDLVLFQSTRPRGARRSMRPMRMPSSSFNPRARVGRDVEIRRCARDFRAVSIHAPAWGATRRASAGSRVCGGFNPRARVGRDLATCGATQYDLSFQSTRPRGARLNGQLALAMDRLFQSTRPRGARLCAGTVHVPDEVFQSTRPRGARQIDKLAIRDALKFQSTRPRGARRGAGEQQRRGEGVSIHAPAWGATA